MSEKLLTGTGRREIDVLDDFEIAEEKKLLRIDLACGQRKKEGYLGLDRANIEGVDFVHDMTQYPWPFESESVHEFRCAHYVEHIPIQLADGSYGLHRFMEEVWRCLMPSGTILIEVPYYMSEGAFQDPTHCRFITDKSFVYYNQDVVKGALDHYLPQCNFEEISKTKMIDPKFEGKGEQAKRWAIQHYFNVVTEAHYVLRKKPLITKEEAK